MERGKTCKNFGGKWQKFDVEPSPNRREREREREKSLRTFEKWGLNKSRSNLKKSLFTIFDWSKISFDWLK